MKNNHSHTNKAGKKIIALAEAMAMNAVPEYWISIKSAGLHLLSLCLVARQLFIHQ